MSSHRHGTNDSFVQLEATNASFVPDGAALDGAALDGAALDGAGLDGAGQDGADRRGAA